MGEEGKAWFAGSEVSGLAAEDGGGGIHQRCRQEAVGWDSQGSVWGAVRGAQAAPREAQPPSRPPHPGLRERH